MSKESLLMAGASRFAHFAGLSRGGAMRAEDQTDEDKKRDDDEKARRAKLTDDERDQEDETARRAALTDDERDKEDEDAKKAKAAENDNGCDDEEEMKGTSSAANARRRERARCAAIFAAPQAAGNAALACTLAFDTTMTRAEAIAVLKSQPARPGASAARSAANPTLGPGGAVSGPSAIAASWDETFKKAGADPKARPLLRG